MQQTQTEGRSTEHLQGMPQSYPDHEKQRLRNGHRPEGTNGT